MAKKVIPEEDKTVLELSEAQAAQFDPEIREKLDEEKKAEPVRIKALSKELFRKGPYAVVGRGGKTIHEYKTRREAYDKALEINTKHNLDTKFVEEIFLG